MLERSLRFERLGFGHLKVLDLGSKQCCFDSVRGLIGFSANSIAEHVLSRQSVYPAGLKCRCQAYT